jgi:hypothetical protein
MAYDLKAIEMSFGVIDALVVNAGRDNEIIIPIDFINDVYIANQSKESREEGYILFDNLRVRIKGNKNYSYASYRSRWIEAEGKHVITALTNSHGGYDYANLKGV